MELIYKDEAYAIVGAAMAVYNELGPGFSESIYQEALEIELMARGILSSPQHEIRIRYKGQNLKNLYRADFICFDKIIVELKALDRLTSREESQVINYLKATGYQVGILINFGAVNDLEWKRMVLTKTPKAVYFRRSQKPKTIGED